MHQAGTASLGPSPARPAHAPTLSTEAYYRLNCAQHAANTSVREMACGWCPDFCENGMWFQCGRECMIRVISIQVAEKSSREQFVDYAVESAWYR